MLGDPRKAITVTMVPIMVSYIFIQLNAFVDAFWCSGLGPDPSSAFLGMLPLLWIIRGIAIGVSLGASVSIARFLGKGEKEKANSIATQAIMLSLIISIIIIPVAFLFVEFVIQWVGLVRISEQCWAYAFPIILSTPMIMLNAVIEGILRAEGAAKKSMIVLVSNALICIVLDPIMVHVANLGIYGVSISTGISLLISTTIGLHWYARKKMYIKISFKNFRFKFDEVINILTVGVTKSSENILSSLMVSVHQAIVVNVIGNIASIAVYSLPWKFVKLATVFSHGAGTALMPICSAAIGAKDFNKVKIGFVYSLKLSIICTIIFAIISFLFADYFSIAFTYSESMKMYREDLVYGIRVYALLMPFIAVIKVASYIFYSLRKPEMSLCASLSRDVMAALLLLAIGSLHDVYWIFFSVEAVIAIFTLSIALSLLSKLKNKLLVTV
ncbi:MAG: polysaccharide biosynthesis C-terminal domain-containing protein [archaeon]|nr:polysaccharide biosynthesis C-terminal domain-containing protein [archaeon]